MHKLRYYKFAWFIFNNKIFLSFLIGEYIFYVPKEEYFSISVLYLIRRISLYAKFTYFSLCIKIKYVIIIDNNDLIRDLSGEICNLRSTFTSLKYRYAVGNEFWLTYLVKRTSAKLSTQNFGRLFCRCCLDTVWMQLA